MDTQKHILLFAKNPIPLTVRRAVFLIKIIHKKIKEAGKILYLPFNICYN